jgi:ketosteroid isomerase-like protein
VVEIGAASRDLALTKLDDHRVGRVDPDSAARASLFRDDERWATAASLIAPLLHPDFECTATLFGTETRSYGGGPEGFRAFWLDWTGPWAAYRTERERITDLGDRVLDFGREFGRRVGSTREVKAFNAAVWTFRDGKVVGFDAYADRAGALKAVGLEE